jgi:hypothetical protein
MQYIRLRYTRVMKVVLKTGRDVRNTRSEAELEKKKKELMESPILSRLKKRSRI